MSGEEKFINQLSEFWTEPEQGESPVSWRFEICFLPLEVDETPA